MADIALDNYARDYTLSADGVDVRGFLSKKSIANFLNIPYAKAPIRFGTAKALLLRDLDKSHGLNAQNYGPRCPQKAGTMHLLMSHMSESLSVPGQREDETWCLNLNIYTPPSTLPPHAGSKIPVLVWIHGGAFISGDNTSQFDGNHLVKRSLELKQPIIIVVLNYRLNVLGFSASRELRADAASRGEKYVANQGLNDQRLALQWIQSHIHHFGGDASKVTLCGESAGGLSVLAHLQADLPLFRQAIVESAIVPPLRTKEQAQAAFDGLARSAGIPQEASSAEKLRILRTISIEELLKISDSGTAFPTPTEDLEWFHTQYDPVDVFKFWGHLPSWCDRIILGNTQHESALLFATESNLTAEFTISISKMLEPNLTVSENVSQGSLSKNDLISWSTMETFIRPLTKTALEIAKNTSHVFMYRISCEDPFPGQPLEGYAWHSFGVPLTFYQPPARAYPELATVQDEMSAAFISFIYGQSPWEPYGHGHRMMRWDGKQAEMVPHDELGHEETV